MKYLNSRTGSITQYGIDQASYHARKWAARLRMEREDVKQELILHILECEKIYNPAKAKLNTFIDIIMRNKIADLVKATNTAKYGRYLDELSLDAMLEGAYDLTDSYDMLDAVYSVIDLKLLSSKLSGPLVALLEQLVNYSVNEIAALSGVSKISIYRRIKKLRSVLRNKGICCVY